MPAKQDRLGFGFCPRLLTGSTDGLHPLTCNHVLSFGSPPGLLAVLRKIWEEDITHQGQRQSYDAIDDEEPSPARMTMNTAQVLVRSCLQETTEHVSNRAGEPKHHGSLADLPRCIPRAQQVMDTRIKTGP